ncbi:MAG TPA: HPr family phosphocarrier protein [Thermoanaerobaculia bacterium]|nr:HPr family phosphocarrier protein [Thermoanaerobaculia bacterium]
MISETLVLKNRLGLHVRAAAKLVQTATAFESKVSLTVDGNEADGKSILGLLQLLAAKGTPILFQIDGSDEAAAMDALRELVERRFDESE